MKTKTMVVAIALGLTAALATETAFAHGRRSHLRFGLFVGVPLVGWHSYAPPPYYYYPPYYPRTIVVPAQPTTYIEQDSQPAVQPSAPAPGSWYYCANARAYYPYVKECPGGWQRVAPQPQG